MERRLAAILAADVVGYSRLMEADEAGTLARLNADREELIHPCVAEHHGRIVKLMGDGTLVEFASVVDAVACAVAIQRGMAERNAAVAADRQMTLRIGVHLGDVIIEGDDLYGDGVNVAARLESRADPGGIFISRQALDQVETKLGFAYDDLGEQRVKNIARPIRVYRVRFDGAAMPAPPRRRARRRATIATVVILIIGITILAWWPPWSSPDNAATDALALPAEPSIAVMPLDNLTGNARFDYIADGIAEDIIAGLSQLPSIFVIGRGSSFAYRDQAVDARQVAAELGVRFILEGSIREAGDSMRITAQLTDALEGRQVWAQQYDRTIGQTFEVIDAITRSIVEELEVKIAEGEQALLRRNTTDNPEAYRLFRLAEDNIRRGGVDDLRHGIDYARQAVALDPDFAAGWGVLAWLIMQDRRFYGDRTGDWLTEPEQMARKALELDPDHAPSFMLFAFSNMYRKAYDQSVVYGQQAVDAWPGSSDINALFAQVLFAAREFDRALAQIRRAMRLSPHFPGWYLKLSGSILLRMGEYEAAIAEFNKALARDPIDYFLASALTGKAEALVALGRQDEALALIARVREAVPWYTLSYISADAELGDQPDLDQQLAVLRDLGLPEE